MIWTPWQVSPLRQIKTPARTTARRPETVCVGVKTMHRRLRFLSGESDQNAKMRPPPSLCGVLRQRCLSGAGHFHRPAFTVIAAGGGGAAPCRWLSRPPSDRHGAQMAAHLYAALLQGQWQQEAASLRMYVRPVPARG